MKNFIIACLMGFCVTYMSAVYASQPVQNDITSAQSSKGIYYTTGSPYVQSRHHHLPNRHHNHHHHLNYRHHSAPVYYYGNHYNSPRRYSDSSFTTISGNQGKRFMPTPTTAFYGF